MQKSLDQLITDIKYFSNKTMVTIWLSTHVGGGAEVTFHSKQMLHMHIHSRTTEEQHITGD